MKTKKKFLTLNKDKIQLYTSSHVFYPTATTEFLIRDSLKKINKRKKVLDLGCGTGIIGIIVNKYQKNKHKIYASDVSEEAIKIAKKNFELHNCNYQLKQGSLFTPWKKQLFDVIINDVSGISEKIAKKSYWFKNVPCRSGFDGTELTKQIIVSAGKHLKKNGIIIFPIISLSNTKKVFKVLKKKFKEIKVLSNNYWFLPNDLSKQINLLAQMKKKKLISYEEKFGKIICNTQIVCAKI